MKTWVIFLRGINVGGHNKLPMADLRESLGEGGLEKVKTYIQSGNVIVNADDNFSLEDVKDRVVDVLMRKHALDIWVLVLSPKQLVGAMTGNPLGQEFEAPNWMFLYFLETVPSTPDLNSLIKLKTENETFELVDDVFYVFAGDGAGRSKMLAKIERALGVPATARNWRTMLKMREFLEVDYGVT